MRKFTKIALCSVSSIMVLAGCSTSQPALQGQLDRNLGSAVEANIDMHAVAPTAAQKANTFIPADPVRTRQARQNYKDNTVAEPEGSQPTSK